MAMSSANMKRAAIAETAVSTLDAMNPLIGRDYRKRENERLEFLARNCGRWSAGRKRYQLMLATISLLNMARMAAIAAQSLSMIAAIRQSTFHKPNTQGVNHG